MLVKNVISSFWNVNTNFFCRNIGRKSCVERYESSMKFGVLKTTTRSNVKALTGETFCGVWLRSMSPDFPSVHNRKDVLTNTSFQTLVKSLTKRRSESNWRWDCMTLRLGQMLHRERREIAQGRYRGLVINLARVTVATLDCSTGCLTCPSSTLSTCGRVCLWYVIDTPILVPVRSTA